jgi:WD40 repeat protein
VKEEAATRLDRYGDPLLPGATARLGTIHRRFDDGTIAWVDEGRTILACNRARSFRWLDARTGKILKSQDWSGPPWKKVLLSPNGKIVAALDGDALTFWDTTTGRCSHRYEGYHGNEHSSLVFSKDGRAFALADKERNTVKLHQFDLATGQRRIVGEHSGATGLAISPDGKRLASAGPYSEIHCWDVSTGRDLWHVHQSISYLSFSPDGRYLAFVNASKLCLLDAATGNDVQQKPLTDSPAGFEPDGGRDKHGRIKMLFGNPLGFDPKGDAFAMSVCDKHGIMGDTAICDFATCNKRFHLPGRYVCFSPDGKTIAGFQGIALQCWDAATGKPLLSDPSLRGHTSAARAMTYSPDGKLLATLGDDHTARLWDFASGRLVHTFEDVGHWPRLVLFTPDGKQLMTCGGDRSCFRFWDVTSGESIRRLVLRPDKEIGEPRHVHVAADGRVLSTLTYIHPQLYSPDPGPTTLTRWDIHTGKPLSKSVQLPPVYLPDYLSAFSPEGHTFVIEENGFHDVPNGHERIMLPKGVFFTTPLGLAFSENGALVAASLGEYKQPQIRSGVVNHGIHVWERTTGSWVIRLRTSDFSHVTLTPDGRRLAAVSSDELRVWEVAGGKEILRQSVNTDLLYEHGCPLVFAPDGRTVALLLRDSTITFWPVAANERSTPPRTPLSAARLEELWADLRQPDAAKAYAALGELLARPGEAVALFRRRMHIAKPVSAEELRKLIDDLDSDDFHRREAASQRLAQLGPQMEDALQATLAKNPSLEMRKRIEMLLAARKALTPEDVRSLRVVRALEQINTAEARELLTSLATGTTNARVAEAVRSAQKRLQRRRP